MVVRGKIKFRIQSKLIGLFLIIALIPLGIAGVRSYENGREVLKQNIGEALQEKAFQTIDKIDRLFYVNQANIESWAAIEVMQDVLTDDTDGRITQELVKLKKNYGIYAGIFCANSAGRIVASSETRLIGTDVSQEPWFQETIRTAGLVVGGFSDDELAGGIAFDTSIPIVAAHNPSQVIGVLSSRLNWSEVFDITNAVEVNPAGQSKSGYVILLDNKGLLISGPDFLLEEGSLLQKIYSVADHESVRRVGQGEKGYLIERYPPAGHEYLAGFAPSAGYQNFKGLGWSVLIFQQTREAFSPIEQLRREFVIIGAFSGMLVFVLAFLFSQGLSDPIKRLTEAASAMSEGDFSRRVTVRSKDELEVLADSFNVMSERLQKTIEQMELKNEKLREKEKSLSSALGDLSKAHEELKQAQAQLFQSEKMASIGQLAAGIAHEINNPIGFISNNIQMLEDYIKSYIQVLDKVGDLKKMVEIRDLEKAGNIVSEIKRLEEDLHFDFIMNDISKLIEQSDAGVERIRKIVADLRTFAREDGGEFEVIKVESVIDGILGIIYHELKYKTELRKEYGETTAIQCQSQKLGQVFINMLINAAQAMGNDKGQITIKTYQKGNNVYVGISDTGKGIPPEHVSRIFDPFFTTKPVGQGTGLGLSISYDIVKQHNGEILVESALGKGTTFTIVLPVDQPKDKIAAAV